MRPDIDAFTPAQHPNRRKTDDWFSVLIGAMNEGLVILDKNACVAYVNPAFCRISGYLPAELVGRDATAMSGLDETNRHILKAHLKENTQGEFRPYTVSLRRKDGNVVLLHISPCRLVDDQGRHYGSFAIITDITERVNVERRLQESEKHLRTLSEQLIAVQETERQRVAADLHDGIGQYLSAMKMRLESQTYPFAPTGAGAPRCPIHHELLDLINDAMEEVRRIAADLRPAMLDDLGIVATVNWFIRRLRISQARIQIEKDVEIQEGDVPAPLKIVIFRLLQEGVNNALKYSNASVLWVRLTKRDGGILVTISDNGSGFVVDEDVEQPSRRRGFGLISMRERVSFSGGSFRITSQAGKGTEISAFWSLSKC